MSCDDFRRLLSPCPKLRLLRVLRAVYRRQLLQFTTRLHVCQELYVNQFIPAPSLHKTLTFYLTFHMLPVFSVFIKNHRATITDFIRFSIACQHLICRHLLGIYSEFEQ